MGRAWGEGGREEGRSTVSDSDASHWVPREKSPPLPPQPALLFPQGEAKQRLDKALSLCEDKSTCAWRRWCQAGTREEPRLHQPPRHLSPAPTSLHHLRGPWCTLLPQPS